MVSGATKTTLIILGIFLIIGVGAAIFFIPSDGGQATGATQCSGGQVLSIDDVSIRFSSELQKDVIRVLFSTVPTAECLDIFVSASEIEDSIDGFDATSSIRGDIILTKKDVEFDIFEDQNKKFLKYDLNDIGGTAFCTDNNCRDEGIANPISSIPLGFFGQNCMCVSENFKGVGGSFSSGSSLVWETEVSIEGNTIILDNSDRSGQIGNIAIVKWAGNLAGDIGISRPNRDVYKPFSDNNFRMIDSGTQQLLIDNYNELTDPIIARGSQFDTQGSAEKQEAVDDARAYNSLFDTRTTNGLSSWVSQESRVKSASIQGNKLIINLNSPIVYPQFTLDIAADEVGIFISTGKPSVDCPNNFDIISGETRDVQIILDNIGQDSGSFSYGINCNKGSSTISPTPPVSISSQGSRIITARMGLTVEEGTETSTCTFTATELNTFEQDSCSFSFTSTKQTQCILDTNSCENGNKELWTCQSDGSFNKVQCDFGCEAFEDEFRCRLQQNEICGNGIDDDGDGLVDFDDPECKEKECEPWVELFGVTIIPNLFCIIGRFFLKFRLIFSGVLGLIGGALGISYLLKFLPSDSETKTKVISSLITFFLVAISLFVLALIFFWWIVLFLIIIGVIRFLLPGV